MKVIVASFPHDHFKAVIPPIAFTQRLFSRPNKIALAQPSCSTNNKAKRCLLYSFHGERQLMELWKPTDYEEEGGFTSRTCRRP